MKKLGKKGMPSYVMWLVFMVVVLLLFFLVVRNILQQGLK